VTACTNTTRPTPSRFKATSGPVSLKSQQEERGLTVEDGWRYFIYGWTQVIGEVFSFEIDDAVVERLCCAAREIVGHWD
jgi:hypothetical protein